MSVSTAPVTAERRAQIVPPAQDQMESLPTDLLHSANAGLVVRKVGQLRSEYRDQGRMFAREMAKHVNARQKGEATAFVYEETFGYEDRLHFLIHLRSFDTYYAMVEMGDQDREYRASVERERVRDEHETGAWDRLFVDGSMRSDVLIPLPATDPDTTGRAPEPVWHSGNAGIVLHRSAGVGYGFRAEALQIARELADAINRDLSGEAGALVYEEAFGAVDRLHWLIHLRDLPAYRRLLGLAAFTEQGRPGTFVDGSIHDDALTPHHWGLYATRQQAVTSG